MKFTAVAVALLAALVEAKPEFTDNAYVVVAGQPFVLTWSGAVGPVTILLKTGPTDDLQTVTTIDCELKTSPSRAAPDGAGDHSLTLSSW